MAGRKDVFEEAMRQGASAAWDQEWDRAIQAYRQALAEFPEDASALVNLGLALLQIDELEEALAVYQRAAQLSPNDPVAVEKAADILERLGRLQQAASAYIAVAEIYLAQRSVDKAIDNWSRASQLAPGLLQAHTRLAMAYERTGKTRQAVLQFLAVARIMQRRGDFAKAMQAAERAAALDPDNQQVLRAIDTLRTGGELPDVEPEVERAPSLRTAPVDAFGGFEEAEPVKQEKPQAQQSPMEAARDRALASVASTLFEMAEEAGDGAAPPGLSTMPGGTNLLRGTRGNRAAITTSLTQAIDAQARGDAEEAAMYYERALDAGVEHAAAHYSLAMIYMELERYGDAINQYKEASAHPGYAAGAYYGMGIAYARADKMRSALSYFLQALRVLDMQTVGPEQADQLSALYETFQESLSGSMTDQDVERMANHLFEFLSGEGWADRIRRARKQLNEQAEDGALVPLAELLSMPGSEHLLEAMSKIEDYLKEGWYGSAMEEAHHAVLLAPTYLPVHEKIADMLMAENRLQQAVTKYTIVSELYRARGEAHKAGQILEKMVQAAPMDVGARSKLIDLLIAQSKIEEALGQHLEMAEAYYRLADLDTARRTYADALRLAQRSNADRPWTVQILERMGDIDVQRLDWRRALRVYEQIKSLAPGDKKTRQTLVELNFRLGQTRQALNEVDNLLRHLMGSNRSAEAIELLVDLVQTNPNDMGLRSRLARLYQRAGRREDVIAQLDALGELQLQAGLVSEAMQTVRAIISLEPDDASAYRELLAQLQAGG